MKRPHTTDDNDINKQEFVRSLDDLLTAYKL